MSVFYEDLSPEEFTRRISDCPVGYLPLGTIEWHCHHLPLGVDCIISRELFRQAAELIGGIVFPALFLGTDRHLEKDGTEYNGMDLYEPYLRCPPYPVQQFPGSCYWVDDETYKQILRSVFRQAARAGFKILMGKGHGPNMDIFMSMADEARNNYGLILLTPEIGSPKYHLTGDHAARGETSAVMYFRPELVHMDRLSEDPDCFPPGVSGYDPRYYASPEYTESMLPDVLTHIRSLIKESLKKEAQS